MTAKTAKTAGPEEDGDETATENLPSSKVANE